MNKWFVSRQSYWGVEPEDQNVVEIASGGLDYANPDMLSAAYKNLGEGQEYDDPRDALTAALAIRDAWRKNKPHLVIRVAHGCTMGMTMPFEGEEDEKALWEWANAAWEKLPKCDQCGGVLPKDHFTDCDSRELKFCSERCAEKNDEDSTIVTCKFCDQEGAYGEMHRHQGGNVCGTCWDERLRTTE